MPNVNPFDLVNKKYDIAVQKREKWEQQLRKLHEKLGKARTEADEMKARAAIEKHENTRRKADAEVEKAGLAQRKRLDELIKGS